MELSYSWRMEGEFYVDEYPQYPHPGGKFEILKNLS